jgi:creatinine amidohydrolase/Fe(II)-dependent formamide hydrolase-like protein
MNNPAFPHGLERTPSGHMRFPGMIGVPEDAFETIVEYAARSFKLHGFKDIVPQKVAAIKSAVSQR